MYRGSKIFKGTVVFGKIIKLLNGKTGIFFGRLFIFIIKIIKHDTYNVKLNFIVIQIILNLI
tara:strand:+ start:1640 stop:1825 length:186 start_codon:yes stop_codon:yes gene_type:complete